MKAERSPISPLRQDRQSGAVLTAQMALSLAFAPRREYQRHPAAEGYIRSCR